MAPSRSSILVLLGLVVSIQAIPAAQPQPDAQVVRQITLDPPTYSISWDPPLPTPPADDKPEDPEDDPPAPPPTDSITLSPPTASISWDGPQPPITTKKPGWPGHWGKRQFEDDPDWPEDPEDPGDGGPIIIPPVGPPQNPPDTIIINPPTATITWGKRQVESGPRPTDFPDDPEEPEDPGDGGPIEIPPAQPTQNPPDTVVINPPTATITWGKRQFESGPEPTDFPDDPEEPEEPGDGPIEIPPAQPTQNPPNTVIINPPTATITWGKRQADEITFVKPTGTISWGKRQDDDDDDIPTPTEINNPLPPAPPDDITLGLPSAIVTWGKREEEAAQFTCGSTNTETTIHPCPTYSCGGQCSLVPGSTTVVPPVIDTGTGIPACPVTATFSNICASCKCPTTFSITTTKLPSPPKPTTSCVTITSTIVPPCVPPTCPHADLVACKIAAPEVKVREIEKTIITTTILTIPPPPTPPTPISDKCTPVRTKTVFKGCPTFTCVPWGSCAPTARMG
ncbi:hypothetical protein CC80DRAFT_19438 [Byssothecium circinans]|uniref:Uncharacterized protein n=1 Tax=Byssothecium circinans TaxID=147558 RepID=A0A6A5U7B5_9PLEO|nr:hypothetical protein CC80DRAFT_19438 [Byssothecium circinans]